MQANWGGGLHLVNFVDNLALENVLGAEFVLGVLYGTRVTEHLLVCFILFIIVSNHIHLYRNRGDLP